MDLAEFQLIRAPRGIQSNDNIELGPEIVLRPKPVFASSHNLPQKEKRVTLAELTDEVHVEGNDPLAVLSPSTGLTFFQRVYAIINLFDVWLRSLNDRIVPPATGTHSGDAAAERLESLLKAYSFSEDDWSKGSQLVLLGYHRALKALMTTDPKTEELFENAVSLTRRVLIAGLLSRPISVLRTLDEEEIYGLLNRKTISLVDVDQATAAPSAKVELIRKASVSDLRVVRREWACYLQSEVANIRNLMATEAVKFTLKSIREREVTEVAESEQRQQTQQEDESRLMSELSQEVNSQLAISINGRFDASAEYKAGMVTARISAGVDAGLSLQRSERHASKIAREAVSRAISRVDTITRESRTVRELTRTEESNEYSLTNKDNNIHAIYRWVDRVDRYQIFRYPDRFLLEFQLPEPAEYYRWRTQQQKDRATSKPPAWELKAEQITPDKLIELATTYRASNLPPVPDEEITVARTITTEMSPEQLPKDEKIAVWNIPPVSKETEIPIPTNYAAVSATYTGHGVPVLGNWAVTNPSNKLDYVQGLHTGVAVIGIGKKADVNWVAGYRWKANTNPPELEFLSHYNDVQDIGSVLQVQVAPSNNPTGESRFSVPYGRAMLVVGTDGDADLQPNASAPIAFDPGAVGTLEVAISTTGLASCVVSVEVRCKRTAQAYAQWQLDVYDALFAAWSQWNDEWESTQNRQALMGMSGADAGSSLRNEQIIREELKRQVIAWLLDESPFEGRPALKPQSVDAQGNPVDDFRDTDFAAARMTATTIQFLEQAFEWTNMSYIFYPYYWAEKDNWLELSQIQANDPEFERFLRAGSVRVILPARPGFDSAVETWLLYQVPFVSGQLPVIGSPLYISIDREIRDLTDPWRGGIAEDFWESRISTTMLYLDTENELPISNDKGQLPAEKGKPFNPTMLCT